MCFVRLTIVCVLAVFLLSGFCFAQGNTTYNFLLNDVGARAAALGGSFLASTDDPNTIFYNPAGLSTLTTRRVSAGFFKHLLDINAGYASFGTRVPDFGTLGVGIVYINYGTFDRTGEEGQNLGTFGAGEFALTAGYAGQLRSDLRYGANAKFIYSSIAEAHSSAAALDFGFQYAAVPNRFLLGVSLLNAGTQISPYMTTREDLPLDFKIGVAIYPEHLPATLLIDLHRLNDGELGFGERLKQFSVGVEFTASENVFLRAGYNNQRRSELKVGTSSGLAGFSVGGGILTGSYSVDYAFTSFGQIGAVHRISIGF